MKFLYIDIDGVLNGHQRLVNGYCGMRPENIGELNRILAEIPDLKLVISSAWRYLVHSGSMNVTGFENLLLSHGAIAYGRVHSVTDTDEITAVQMGLVDEENRVDGLKLRPAQIIKHATDHNPEAWVALDDLALDLPEELFVQTDGAKGLTPFKANEAIKKLIDLASPLSSRSGNLESAEPNVEAGSSHQQENDQDTGGSH